MQTRTYGETTTEEKNNLLERKIKANNREWGNIEEQVPIEDIETFLLNSSNFFLSQWISIVDKIFKKPTKLTKKERDNNKKRKKETGEIQTTCPIENPTYKARESLRQAIIKVWKDKKISIDEDEKTLYNKYSINSKLNSWRDKVHPYQPLKSNPKNKKYCTKVANRGIETGGWYETFASFAGVISADKLQDCHYKIIAEKIYSHLYEKEIIKIGNSKVRTKKYGLIKNKSKSISKNARRLNKTDNIDNIFSKNEATYLKALQNQPINWNDVKQVYDLDSLIKKLKEKEQDNHNINYFSVVECINNHYRKIFECDTNKKNLDLLTYHQMIKDTLKYRYPKQRKRKYEDISESLLHNLTLQREGNRQLAFALRLGKTIHYETCEQENSTPLSLCKENEKIVSSVYWTSDGQTKIKQRESFVRQWLSAISVANSTMARLLDPDEKLNTILGELPEETKSKTDYNKIDFMAKVTIENAIEYMLSDEDEGFNERFNLIFGSNTLYENTNQRNFLIEAIRQTIGAIRNNSFHFKNIQKFKNALEGINNLSGIGGKKTKETKKAVIANVNTYIEQHLDKQKILLKEQFQSAEVENYFSKEQFLGIYKLVAENDRNSFPLPKFNNLLARSEEIHNIIIIPATEQVIKDTPYYLCQYTTLKLLYERDFSNYIDKAPNNQARKWVESARARKITTTEQLRDKEFIQSRIETIRSINENENILQYMTFLTKKTAQSFFIQKNKYTSDKVQAKKHSEQLENFKKEIIVYAFHDYLDKKGLKFIKESLKEITPPFKWKNIVTIPNDSKIQRPWLYLVLNLMPVEFVNHLFLSIRKSRALIKRDNSEDSVEIYDDFAKAISLYLDMHDVGLDDQKLSEDEIKQFYGDSVTIRKDEDGVVIPIKGLREISRFSFGNLSQLKAICNDYKVKQDDVNQINDFLKVEGEGSKSKIADSQAVIKKYREEISGKGYRRFRKNNIKDKEEYIENYKTQIEKITQYRHLKNKTTLNDHKKIHQLMKAVSGRLLGFSQIWERDIYFVVLALVFANEGFENIDRLEEKLKQGQMISVLDYIYRSKNKEFNDLINKFMDTPFNNKQTRNDLAHFNKIRENTSGGINLTELINNTRTLMAYDRKLKNAVSKSIIDLLGRYNIEGKDILYKGRVKKGGIFKMENHQLQLKNMQSKTINHLNNKDIPEQLLSDSFVKTVEKMFKD